MLLISESFAILIVTLIGSFLLLPSAFYRLYYYINLNSPNTWLLIITSAICITAGCFQEAMVRRINKKLGKVSLYLYILALPLTLYNIIFSDPAPYFTLCMIGCFSQEDCITVDQTWGNYTSLTYVLSLAALLSAEVLAIRFNYLFLKFSNQEIKTMVDEVNAKYSEKFKKIKEAQNGANLTQVNNCKGYIVTKVGGFANETGKNDNEAVETKSPGRKDVSAEDLANGNYEREGERKTTQANGVALMLRDEFMKVDTTMRPFNYRKV